jgi:hypothetical protein
MRHHKIPFCNVDLYLLVCHAIYWVCTWHVLDPMGRGGYEAHIDVGTQVRRWKNSARRAICNLGYQRMVGSHTNPCGGTYGTQASAKRWSIKSAGPHSGGKTAKERDEARKLEKNARLRPQRIIRLGTWARARVWARVCGCNRRREREIEQRPISDYSLLVYPLGARAACLLLKSSHFISASFGIPGVWEKLFNIPCTLRRLRSRALFCAKFDCAPGQYYGGNGAARCF